MKITFLFLVVCLSISSDAQQNANTNFSFIVFGDMPYFLPQDLGRFENVIKTVNQQQPAFSVHVGDIKSSVTECSDDYFKKIYSYFQLFNDPLIYTPGDNEWTDCWKNEAGAYQPEERLSSLRTIFFSDEFSLGQKKLKLKLQSERKAFSRYVENRSWKLDSIFFATVHVVGSNNNLQEPLHNDEFEERNKANVSWLEEIFTLAKKDNLHAIFLFMQADMFSSDKAMNGFESIIKTIQQETLEFKRPVILINGDSHRFLVDKPITEPGSKRVLSNFTRIQVFGEHDMHLVRIIVTPESSPLFHVEQLFVKDN